MSRRVDDIDGRIAELDKLRAQEDARERRILEAEARFFAKQEEAGGGALKLLFDQLKVPAADVKRFYDSQEAQAKRVVEEATSLLQLTSEEVGFIQQRERALCLINPCGWVHASPGWICVWHASSWGWWHYETANASCSCTCNLPNNELNPKAAAYGQADLGWRSAALDCWLWFDVPARPSPANVLVKTWVETHGFYILQQALGGSATLSVDLEAKGYQYGWSWGSASTNILSLSGTTMGRHDGGHFLDFHMPIGADPFQVCVKVRIRVRARKAGSLSLVDFATGAGNYIKAWWVNTYTP